MKKMIERHSAGLTLISKMKMEGELFIPLFCKSCPMNYRLLSAFLFCCISSVCHAQLYCKLLSGDSSACNIRPPMVTEQEMVEHYKKSLTFRKPNHWPPMYDCIGSMKVVDKKKWYAGVLSEKELLHLFGEWKLVEEDLVEKLFLKSLKSDSASVSAEKVFQRLVRQYGKSDHGVSASWVTANLSFSSFDCDYWGKFVTDVLMTYKFEKGIKKGHCMMGVTSEYTSAARRHNGIKLHEKLVVTEFNALGLFSYDVNRNLPRSDSERGLRTAVFLLLQDSVGKASVRTLYPQHPDTVFQKAIDHLCAVVEDLPKWSFRQFFTEDGRLLSGRYILAHYLSGRWRMVDALNKTIARRDKNGNLELLW